jgi:uncharacterized protein YjbI with pentapeptide repeats
MTLPTCSECERVSVNGEHCLVHLSDAELYDAFAWLREHPLAHLDLRDATIHDALFKGLLDGLRAPDGTGPIFPRCDFGAATFTADADFAGVVFRGRARFSEAVFEGTATFRNARFEQTARFRHVRFRAPASFRNATFVDSTTFPGTTFEAGVRFDQITAESEFAFSRAEVSGEAVFAGSTFTGPFELRRARFSGPATFAGVEFMDKTAFQHTIFEQTANFHHTHFATVAHFDVTRFLHDARFTWTTFDADARFAGQVFSGPARFRGAHFRRVATFTRGRFDGSVDFNSARFDGDAGFNGTIFKRHAHFSGTTFSGVARFDEATFESSARFANAVFEDATSFRDARVAEDVRCHRAQFKQTRSIGPLRIGGAFVLDDTSFGAHVDVTADAGELSARRTTFHDGAHLRVARANVVLEDADFVRRSMLSRLIAGHLPERLATSDERPRLLTLRGAHVAPLAIEDVDLRPCLFSGAHGLASLRLEATCQLPLSPASRGSARRVTIAEEHRWRRGTERSHAVDGWYPEESRPPAGFHDGYGDAALSPAQIATIYRALREARESHKDEAGAGDLYYDEMEMRRHSEGSVGERFVLTAYWLLSGYGVRAARSFACLAVTLIVGAALLWWFGFHDPMSYGRSLIFAVESAISVLRPPDEALSAAGQVVQIVLRLAGPLLFGLGLLAIRARVKR